jgi:hypothetical protein
MNAGPLHFLILTVAGWLQRRREEYIAYLLAETAVYKEHFAKRGLRLTDVQRRRLAVKGKAVGRARLAVSPRSARRTPSCAGTDNSSRRSTTAAASAGPVVRAPVLTSQR